MTRFSAAAAISICWFVCAAAPAAAQPDPARTLSCGAGEILRDGVCLPDEGKCFPWQEFRNGNCVAKSTSAAPPAPSPAGPTLQAAPARCVGGAVDAAGQCACPVNTREDAESGNCVAAAVPPAPVAPVRKASDNVVCDGGTLSDGKCACPAGFELMPVTSNAASGTCVKTDAPNCLGGELTVAGTCFCNGQVTMSGQDYSLELVGGKCVPKRCPQHSYLKDGKCVAGNDRNFSFTCRTGYIPDEANPGTTETGLHCLPDPTFCDPGVKRKDGACPKSSAVAIDCFGNKCTCRDPHADWTDYLCQCVEPYRSVNGACVEAGDRAAPGGEKDRPEPREESSTEPIHRRACGHGMVRAHGDCVPARRRYPTGVYQEAPGMTGYPGELYPRRGSRTYPLRDDALPRREH